MRTDLSVWYQSVIKISRGTGDKVNIRWEFGGADNKNYEFSYTKPWIDSKETSATITLYDVTNEYADYDRNADEIARYDKKRRGQELTFSRKTNNEYVSNYLTLKNRDDIYKGAVDGYSTQYYEDSWGNNSDYDSRYDGPKYDGEYRRKKNFGLTAVSVSPECMIHAIIFMIRMKAKEMPIRSNMLV